MQQQITTQDSGMQQPTISLATPQSGMQQPTTPLATPQSGMQQPTTPLATPQSGMQQPTIPLATSQSGMQQPTIPLATSQSGMQQPTTPLATRKSNTPTPDVLLQPDEVIFKYPRLLTISCAGRLAVRLACESYFGKPMLKNCTVHGQKNYPALPKEKVMELKKKIISVHPQFISTPVEFEPIWTKCVNAINHCASSLRSKAPPTLIDLSN